MAKFSGGIFYPQRKPLKFRKRKLKTEKEMITILTTNSKNTFEEIAEYNKHLVEEGEGMKIKSCWGQRIYYKVNGKMQLTLKNLVD